jgi:hypothetical protein
MYSFQIFVHKVGWPIMQYKISLTNVLWSLKDGPTIQLWKVDVTRQLQLSVWVSNPIPFRLIWGVDELKAGEKERFIDNEILKYVEFWKLRMLKDDLHVKVMDLYMKYWESILELLSRFIPQQSFILLEGFWLSSNWKINYERASIHTIVDVDPKDLVILPYYGHRSLCLFLNVFATTTNHDFLRGSN